MRRVSGVGVAIAVILAGCSGVPFVDPPPQDEPAPVKLVNNATQTETFRVAVVEEGATVFAEFRDGRTANYTMGPGSGTIENNPKYPIERIEFPASAQHHGEYTLAPGESKLIEVEPVAPNQAIVVLVYDEEDETYRSIKSLSCGGAILGYRVTTQKGGFRGLDDIYPPVWPEAILA